MANKFSENQIKALKQAQNDVRMHWAELMDTTPLGVDRMLNDVEFGVKFGKLFNKAVLDVLDQVYGRSK